MMAETPMPSYCARIEALYRETGPRLRRFVRLKLGDAEEAEEVVQEAFAALLGRGDNAAIDALPAYLFRTAANLANDRLRRRRLWREVEHVDPSIIELPSSEPGPDRAFAARSDMRHVRLLLGELPERCRQAFVRHRFEAQDYATIANEMQISESMVRKHVLRAMRHCLERLEAGIA